MVQFLNELAVNEEAHVVGFTADSDASYRRQLMRMGVLPNTRIRITRVAPLGDPVELTVRGYRLTLRRAEAAVIQVERV